MPSPRAVSRALWATRAQFAALGALSGMWGAHIPSVKACFALDDAGVSSVLLAGAVGALATLWFAGRVVGRLGARRAAMLAVLTLGAALGSVLAVPAFGWLLPAVAVFGAAGSVLDVAINAEGTVLETVSRRAVMSQLHGMFSLGGMAGAAVAAAMLHAGVPAAVQLPAAGAAFGIGAAFAARGMLAVHPRDDVPRAHFGWPRGPLLAIGLLILAGMTCEGVMYDWSVLYLKDEVGLAQSNAAIGYAVFSAAMAAARFGGDALRARRPERSIVRAGAALAALAMAAVLLTGSAAVAFVGYALVGIGLAPVVPILYNAATRVPGVSRAAAIASVSSIGYAGFMLGPPLIGTIAKAASLAAAMGVIVAAAGVLAAGAGRVPAE